MAGKAHSVLEPGELSRYARHFALPEFGRQGQERLKAGKVLVVGAGGLGCPLIQYLAAAGIGRLGIVDFDIVDKSNLQRQVLYGTGDLGRPKAEVAAARVRALNPYVDVRVHRLRLDSSNALEVVADYDVVADGTDNFPTRYLVNDACVLAGKTNVWAAIFRFDGQVSVFNHRLPDGSRGPDYRDLFPEPPPPGSVPSCAEGGVLGVLPGLIGCLQANEVIKVVAGVGEPLAGRLFVLDALSMQSRVLEFDPAPDRPAVTGLIDYEAFCGGPSGNGSTLSAEAASDSRTTPSEMKEITVRELQAMRARGEDFQLVDVREPYETEIATLEGELIPLAEIAAAQDRIARDKKVVMHCRTGVRSGNAVRFLEDQFGFDNLFNLKGGIQAWSREIDPAVPEY